MGRKRQRGQRYSAALNTSTFPSFVFLLGTSTRSVLAGTRNSPKLIRCSAQPEVAARRETRIRNRESRRKCIGLVSRRRAQLPCRHCYWSTCIKVAPPDERGPEREGEIGETSSRRESGGFHLAREPPTVGCKPRSLQINLLRKRETRQRVLAFVYSLSFVATTLN